MFYKWKWLIEVLVVKKTKSIHCSTGKSGAEGYADGVVKQILVKEM